MTLHLGYGLAPTSRPGMRSWLDYVERDPAVFRSSRAALYAAGEPLLKRAHEARVVRAGLSAVAWAGRRLNPRRGMVSRLQHLAGVECIDLS